MNEVILLERGRWRSVLGRTSRLCGDGGAELFGQWIVLLASGALFVTAFRWAVEVVTDPAPAEMRPVRRGGRVRPLLAFFSWIVDLKDWRAQVAIWIVVAFSALARFLTYIDRRIRLEGWEVELRLRMVGATMEDAERW